MRPPVGPRLLQGGLLRAARQGRGSVQHRPKHSIHLARAVDDASVTVAVVGAVGVEVVPDWFVFAWSGGTLGIGYTSVAGLGREHNPFIRGGRLLGRSVGSVSRLPAASQLPLVVTINSHQPGFRLAVPV